MVSSANYEKWSQEKLVQEIERLKNAVKKQDFGLVWMNVPEAFEGDSESQIPIFQQCPELDIKNNSGRKTNVLIEGENYHALTCLNYTHKNRVDVIYIDPPYNTGVDGFRYHDKRVSDKFPDGSEVPKDHPFRHSYWLSFMHKRLELAHSLLSESGVIAISIDINEMSQLKLLMDDVFGESNLISLLSLKIKDPAGVGQQSFVFDVNEYVLIYAKNGSAFKNQHPELPFDFEKLNEQYGSYKKIIRDFGEPKFLKEINRQNVGKIKIYSCKGAKIERTSSLSLKEYAKLRDVIFADYNPNGGMILAIKDQIPSSGLSYIEYTPTKGRNAGETVKTYFLNGRIIAWLSNVTRVNNGSLEKVTKMTNNWNIPNASLYLEGGVDFTNGKKPLYLIKKLLGMFNNPNATVLDFFAGSGTTGEAVMDMNLQDGGDRQFILVTNDEEVGNNGTEKIMSDVCYPRIKNAIKGYRSKKGSEDGLKYLKVGFVGQHNIMDASDQDAVELALNAGGLLALAENTLFEDEKNGYMQFFSNNESHTAIYFNEDLKEFESFKKKVGQLKMPTSVYMFSWGEQEFVDDFSSYRHVTVKTIPRPILEIYKRIYNLGSND